MNKRELNFILNKHKELKKEINNIIGVNGSTQMKVIVCTNKSSLTTFNLRELNKHLFI